MHVLNAVLSASQFKAPNVIRLVSCMSLTSSNTISIDAMPTDRLVKNRFQLIQKLICRWSLPHSFLSTWITFPFIEWISQRLMNHFMGIQPTSYMHHLFMWNCLLKFIHRIFINFSQLPLISWLNHFSIFNSPDENEEWVQKKNNKKKMTRKGWIHRIFDMSGWKCEM